MTESYFESNFELLKKKNAAWAGLILAQREGKADIPNPAELTDFDVVDSKNGAPTLMVRRNDEEIFYHSRYDPLKEAKHLVDNAYTSKQNYFALLGMGLGYTAEALLDRVDGTVYIVEPNTRAFIKAMEHRDLSRILDSNRVALSVGQAWNEAITGWVKIAKLYDLKGVGIVELPGAMKAAPDGYFDLFKEKMKAHIVTLGGNLQTVMLKGWEYQRNTLSSLPRIIDNPPVRLLFDRFKSRPAIIVSAGPSLKKNIDLLKELKGHAVIIGVDTSLKPMLKAGFEPDFICTGDPQFANYKHLAGAKVKDSHLVAEPMTWPQSMVEFDGKLFIASYGDKMMQWLSGCIPDVGHVMCWGSVATMAFDLARKLGCDPIIFTGQDLSFSGGRTYVEGTYFEDEAKQDMSAEAFARREKTYQMENIYGEMVPTNRQMFAYLNWFTYEISRTEAHVVNATEGGILKDGVEIITLKEAAEKYLSNEFSVVDEINKAKDEFKSYALASLRGNLRRALESMERLLKESNTGLKKIEEVINKTNNLAHYPPEICREAINSLDQARLRMASEPAMRDFIEFANQTGMFNFVKRYNKVQGKKFSKRIMDEAMDMYADLFHSTRRTIGKVKPFFAQALNAIIKREEMNG